MPKFLETKLKREYPNEPAAPYKIMNKLGAMSGNKETALGRTMQKAHVDQGHTNIKNPASHAAKLRRG